MTEDTTGIDLEFLGVEELPASMDVVAVKRMQVVAKALDESIRVPGTSYRIGLDPLIGLVPGGGDLFAGLLSLYIVAESARLGVSFATLLHMAVNIALDVGVGTIPYAGDIFDAGWKANKRNVQLAVKELSADTAVEGDRTKVELD